VRRNAKVLAEVFTAALDLVVFMLVVFSIVYVTHRRSSII
jgi:hypothetical protein